MPRRTRADPRQLELFPGDVPTATPAPAAPPRPAARGSRGRTPVGPAPQPPEIAALAAALPPLLYLGTSSWSFPGWAGLVYDRPAPAAELARDGLAAYARHPLLRAVGIDRTYYAPLSAADFARYAAAVPAHFRFLVKAADAVTAPTRAAAGHAGRRTPNPRFLDATYAADTLVAPFVAGLGPHAGPLVFQFTPQPKTRRHDPAAFIARLHAFLAALPRGPLYAVELRTAALLGPDYAAALAATGVAHCYNVHPAMPPPDEQAQHVPVEQNPALVARWMLNARYDYDAARTAYAPFDRLVDEDPRSRAALADLCGRALRLGRPAFVAANNKAEGSAPLTLVRLARQIVMGA